MHVHQLQCQDNDFEDETFHLQHMRLEEKERHDLKHGVCQKKLAIRSIVLLYDTRHKKDMSRKLPFKWLRPYQICDVVKDIKTYMLKKLDRLQLAGIFADKRLKKFHTRQRLQLDYAPNLDHEETPPSAIFLQATVTINFPNPLTIFDPPRIISE